jgi:hypothetical protein
MTDAATLDKLLAHTFTPSDIGDEMTVREYLCKLLKTMLRKGESFSGKRPFGNSGWERNLVVPAIQCGALKGVIDDSDPDYPEGNGWALMEYDDLLQALAGHAMGIKS